MMNRILIFSALAVSGITAIVMAKHNEPVAVAQVGTVITPAGTVVQAENQLLSLSLLLVLVLSWLPMSLR